MLQILVRHGESVSNTEGRVQGQEDVALSQLGEAQAKALAQWSVKQFSKTREAIDEIWSSPLIRAQCTAVRIAEALGLPLSIDERLSGSISLGSISSRLHRHMVSGHTMRSGNTPDTFSNPCIVNSS